MLQRASLSQKHIEELWYCIYMLKIYFAQVHPAVGAFLIYLNTNAMVVERVTIKLVGRK